MYVLKVHEHFISSFEFDNLEGKVVIFFADKKDDINLYETKDLAIFNQKMLEKLGFFVDIEKMEN